MNESSIPVEINLVQCHNSITSLYLNFPVPEIESSICFYTLDYTPTSDDHSKCYAVRSALADLKPVVIALHIFHKNLHEQRKSYVEEKKKKMEELKSVKEELESACK